MKKNSFKQKLIENRGKSIDGTKVNGKSLFVDRNLEVYVGEKIIKVDIMSGNVTDENKINLMYQCKDIVNFVDRYSIGQKIPLSSFADTIYDLKLISKQITGNIQQYQFITI